jgi:hypothetical protein
MDGLEERLGPRLRFGDWQTFEDCVLETGKPLRQAEFDWIAGVVVRF